MKAVLLVPGEDAATTSVVVVDEAGQRALRRLHVALPPGDAPARRARAPPAPAGELKAELAGDLLCLEYRER